MKQIALFLMLTAACAAPLSAQTSKSDEFLKEFDEFSDSAKEFFQGLIQEYGPALEGLRESIPDFSQYEAPEILPNGDIIIRRKTPLPETQPNTETSPDGQTEL